MDYIESQLLPSERIIARTTRSKIVLEANPYYRGFVWDFKSNGDPGDDRIVKEMKGKQMPQVGRVEINIIEEDQGR